ncbi:putative LOB domain-containing protein [Hibiscus syriacus]|uniref:RING-type E3 ubiquitin transferase n=1 Tax=Hibiscus syriacus TaxID=106335 RepID=A0A6A2ZSG3_HIBSY|nr:U-box domain-containing protein 1-like [Hibiscus syriacus]KAE8694838.1 putative LOB domain-containing protein [Hibiscus syriacus]
MMGSSGFLPSGSLLESLIHLSNEVSSIEKLPFVQGRNISTMIRRIKVLTSLFEEIKETSSTTTTQLPPSSVLCLTELFSVIRRVKVLMEGCKDSSSLWGLIQTETTSNQFFVLVKEIGRALDILPLSLLNVTADIREQVELLHKQAKQVELFVDPREVQRRDELLRLMASNNDKNNRCSIDFKVVKHVFSSIGMRGSLDYEEEISKLEAEAQKQAGTGGLIVVSNINNLLSLVSYSKSMIFCEEIEKHDNKQPSVSVSRNIDRSSSSQSMLFNIPDEFRCPISLDLMKDPVIVSSGHTYDRNSIAQWINTGHHTCPKSGQRLIHMALIPNYALKSLVHQWCQENNIPLTECSSNVSESEINSKQKASEKAIDHISATKVAIYSVKMTAEFLVGKLAMGSLDIQRQAAYELRLLAKTGMNNRRIIAEAGAIPFLMTMLTSNDPRIQENAVTALLNLSIFDNNKILIMAAGAIGNIVEVLELGKTMEARENAAAAIFSLSIIDDFKVAIGAHARAIPALICLLKEGTTTGKRDAATALSNLALYGANKANIAVAGAVPLLIELLMDDKAGITDDALGVLALLLSCPQGLEDIKNSRALVPLLIDLLRFGSAKGKENSITLLLGLCKDGGDEVARRLLINPRSIPSLQSLAADGSPKARRKADALLRLLNRCCSQSHNPV